MPEIPPEDARADHETIMKTLVTGAFIAQTRICAGHYLENMPVFMRWDANVQGL
jgi:hypothetical protein